MGKGIISILRNGGNLFSAAVAEIILRGLYMIAIGRMLGPDHYGLWTYALSTYGLFLSLTGLGMPQIVPMELGRDTPGRGEFLNAALGLRLVALATSIGALVVFAFTFEPSGPAQWAVLATIPAMAARDMAVWFRLVFTGLQDTGYASRVGILMRCAEVAGGIAALALGAGVIALIAIHCLSWIVESRSLFGRLGKLSLRLRPSSSLSEMKDIFVRGIPYAISGVLGGWLMLGPIILLKQSSDDLNLVGQFSLALQLSYIVLTGFVTFLSAAYPVLARSKSLGDQRVQNYGMIVALAVAGVFSTGSLIAYLIGPALIAFVFGDGFEVAGTLLWLLVASGGASLLSTGYSQVFAVSDRPWTAVVADCVGVIALIALFPMMLETQGLTGVALTLVIAQALKSLVVVFWFTLTGRRGEN